MSNLDVVESRLKVATSMGADYTLLTKTEDSEDSIVKSIIKTLGCQPHVSIDCTGAEKCVRVALEVTASAGTAVLVGLGAPDLNIPLTGALIREVDIKGTFRYVNDYPTALELVATGKVNVKPLVTHHFTMEDTLKAFETSRTGAGNAIKVLIHANPEWKP